MLNRNWQCQTMKLVYSIRLPQSISDILVNVRNTRVAWASFLFDNSHRLIFLTASLILFPLAENFIDCKLSASSQLFEQPSYTDVPFIMRKVLCFLQFTCNSRQVIFN